VDTSTLSATTFMAFIFLTLVSACWCVHSMISFLCTALPVSLFFFFFFFFFLSFFLSFLLCQPIFLSPLLTKYCYSNMTIITYHHTSSHIITHLHISSHHHISSHIIANNHRHTARKRITSRASGEGRVSGFFVRGDITRAEGVQHEPCVCLSG
jgi:hypothetical protein